MRTTLVGSTIPGVDQIDPGVLAGAAGPLERRPGEATLSIWEQAPGRAALFARIGRLTCAAVVLDRASVDNRGLMVGLVRTAGDVGIIVGPLLVGGLLDFGQPVLVFYVVAAVIALFALLSWYVFQHHAAS